MGLQNKFARNQKPKLKSNSDSQKYNEYNGTTDMIKSDRLHENYNMCHRINQKSEKNQ